jgi:hypothetical protein
MNVMTVTIIVGDQNLAKVATAIDKFCYDSNFMYNVQTVQLKTMPGWKPDGLVGFSNPPTREPRKSKT